MFVGFEPWLGLIPARREDCKDLIIPCVSPGQEQHSQGIKTLSTPKQA